MKSKHLLDDSKTARPSGCCSIVCCLADSACYTECRCF